MDLSLLELKDVLGNIKNLGERGIDSLYFKIINTAVANIMINPIPDPIKSL